MIILFPIFFFSFVATRPVSNHFQPDTIHESARRLQTHLYIRLACKSRKKISTSFESTVTVDNEAHATGDTIIFPSPKPFFFLHHDDGNFTRDCVMCVKYVQSAPVYAYEHHHHRLEYIRRRMLWFCCCCDFLYNSLFNFFFLSVVLLVVWFENENENHRCEQIALMWAIFVFIVLTFRYILARWAFEFFPLARTCTWVYEFSASVGQSLPFFASLCVYVRGCVCVADFSVVGCLWLFVPSFH